MDWITSPEAWIDLLTLTVMEIVLGIDNVVFISVLVQPATADVPITMRLPEPLVWTLARRLPEPEGVAQTDESWHSTMRGRCRDSLWARLPACSGSPGRQR